MRPAQKRPFPRRDATGHLDPRYAKDLRKHSLASGSRDDATAFVERPRTVDALAEVLGEDFVAAATTGEEVRLGQLNEGIPEEMGGPFVITKARHEFARGRDGSNPRGATREPFPRVRAEEERPGDENEESAEGSESDGDV
jgi:hypothetical protein